MELAHALVILKYAPSNHVPTVTNKLHHASSTQDWTGEAELADALVATAQRLPRARFVATTLGTKGAVLLERPARGAGGQRRGDGGGGIWCWDGARGLRGKRGGGKEGWAAV